MTHFRQALFRASALLVAWLTACQSSVVVPEPATALRSTMTVPVVTASTSPPTSSPAPPTLSPTPSPVPPTPTRFWQRQDPPETIFGVEMDAINDKNGLPLFAPPTTWVRRTALEWNRVEPTAGVRDWRAVRKLKEELARAAANGLQVILVVRGAPDWAAPQSCGPITDPAGLAAFADFMREAVAQFPMVRYWELWNEPDIDYAILGNPKSAWGCWGDGGDREGYGGSRYAAMLKAVYPAMKAANPEAQVVAGALLLDCDPAHPPFDKNGQPEDCTPAKFLNGILRAGGGDYLDGVSFHAYDYYSGQLGRFGSAFSPESRWSTTGPAVVAKARYVRNVLEPYAAQGKFLMNTEAALLTQTGVACDTACETTKAYYLAQAYASALAEELRANIWYSVLGWPGRNTALLDQDLNPLPAYLAYQVSASTLRDAVYQGEVTTYAGVKGYQFDREDARVWVLWSLDGQAHAITLPGKPRAIHAALGDAWPLQTRMVVDVQPVYIVW